MADVVSNEFDIFVYMQVKTAINNATRAREVARKSLITMSRDCNRFCKIMV